VNDSQCSVLHLGPLPYSPQDKGSASEGVGPDRLLLIRRRSWLRLMCGAPFLFRLADCARAGRGLLSPLAWWPVRTYSSLSNSLRSFPAYTNVLWVSSLPFVNNVYSLSELSWTIFDSSVRKVVKFALCSLPADEYAFRFHLCLLSPRNRLGRAAFVVPV